MCKIKLDDIPTFIREENWKQYINSNNRDIASTVKDIFRDIYHLKNHMIYRRYCKDTFRSDSKKGIFAAIIWGYPKGKFPGGRNFDEIMNHASNISKTIDELKKANATLEAKDIFGHFSQFKNLGPSTLTKCLYFAEIRVKEGPCLIYDKMVIRSITHRSSIENDNFSKLRDIFSANTKGINFQKETYAAYLKTINDIANCLRIKHEEIEFDLYSNAPRR